MSKLLYSVCALFLLAGSGQAQINQEMAAAQLATAEEALTAAKAALDTTANYIGTQADRYTIYAAYYPVVVGNFTAEEQGVIESLFSYAWGEIVQAAYTRQLAQASEQAAEFNTMPLARQAYRLGTWTSCYNFSTDVISGCSYACGLCTEANYSLDVAYANLDALQHIFGLP